MTCSHGNQWYKIRPRIYIEQEQAQPQTKLSSPQNFLMVHEVWYEWMPGKSYIHKYLGGAVQCSSFNKLQDT